MEKIIRIITNTVNPKDSGQISTDGHTDYSRNYMIWMVQVIILHGIPGGTATHGKRGTAQV